MPFSNASSCTALATSNSCLVKDNKELAALISFAACGVLSIELLSHCIIKITCSFRMQKTTNKINVDDVRKTTRRGKRIEGAEIEANIMANDKYALHQVSLEISQWTVLSYPKT